MAYLAVTAHQSFLDMKKLSLYEIDTFVDHVSMLVEMQNEHAEKAIKRSETESNG